MTTSTPILSFDRDVATPTEQSLESAERAREEFTQRVAPHLPRLHRLCLTLSRDVSEAEDLLQNALLKAYLHQNEYRGNGRWVSWLYGIVRHEHAEIARRMGRRRGLLEAALAEVTDLLDAVTSIGSAQDPETSFIRCEETSLMLSCLRQVPEPYRSVIHLCDVEDLGYGEVAELLEVSVGTVKSRHARGRAKLRDVFVTAQGGGG